jgi:hypothetical protein
MPLPPAMHSRWRGRQRLGQRRAEAALRLHHLDRVAGLQRPACSQLEKAPPGTRRTPTRRPSSAAAQIEYERRRSSPPCGGAASGIARAGSGRCRAARPARRRTRPSRRRCRGAPRARAGDGSEVRSSSGIRWSDRLEVFEGFAAGEAAVQRLAGGGAEGRQALGVALPQRGQSTLRAWMRIGIGPSCTAACPLGGAMPYARSLRRPSSLIQSVVQAGARRVRHRHRREAGGDQRRRARSAR